MLKLIKQTDKPEFYLVNSDNFEDAVLDAAAYKELTFQMSTGDFHMHKAIPLWNPSDDQINSCLYYDQELNAFLPY